MKGRGGKGREYHHFFLYTLSTDCSADHILSASGNATQISTHGDFAPGQAVDGNLTTMSCTAEDKQPWWSVDLGTAHDVGHVTVVVKGTDGICRT